MPIKDISESNARLLCFGAKQTGSFLGAYGYVEESLYVDEAEDILKFCEFIDTEVGGGSMDNIVILYRAYKNPNEPWLKEFVQNLKAQIEEIKEFMRK